MAASTRSSKLETRNARKKLKAADAPYWVSIGRTLHLGYRKGTKGSSWSARLFIDGKYVRIKLGKADDFLDANGTTILNYFQAQEKTRQLASEAAKPDHLTNTILTVEEAVKSYLTWYQTHRKAHDRTQRTAEAHILPKLGNQKLDELTPMIIRQWHEELAKEGPRLRSTNLQIKRAKLNSSTEGLRKRRATANRILTVLKAALNHAWRDGSIASDDAWRKVKPFHNVDSPKIRYISLKECERLVNACEPDFRNIVEAALLTGCRYGELTQLKVYDFDRERGTLHIRETKNGKSRYMPLTDEGINLFTKLSLGKFGADLMLTRKDGQAWGTSHQARRLAEACKIAKITPAISFHVLRHTYGSILASKGVALQVIAELLGHSDTRITSRHYAHLSPSYVSDTLRANLPQFMETKKSKVVNM